MGKGSSVIVILTIAMAIAMQLANYLQKLDPSIYFFAFFLVHAMLIVGYGICVSIERGSEKK